MKSLTLLCLLAVTQPANDGWIELSTKEGFTAWREPSGQWFHTTEVTLKPGKPRELAGIASVGPIIVNGPTGRTKDLLTKQKFRDVEFHCEFLLGEKSNSGVKFIQHYEIQLLDSFGKPAEALTGSDCGGIYPRGESLPSYHTIDRGTPPRVNACRKAGEWQSLDILFRAPRFGPDGSKIENARFLKVVLNDHVIHENIELKYPTGSAWRKSKELPEGPILLQGDHGPVAFRSVRVRPVK